MSREVDIAGRSVRVTHPERVLFPDAGVTKGDVVDYYVRIADVLLPHVAGRPLVVQRFPEGIGGGGFYQKNTPRHAPDWLATVDVPTADGGSTRYPVVEDAAGLAFLANYGSVVLHTLLNAAHDLERPVEVIWDLDPSSDDLEVVRDAARHLRDVLEGLRLRPRVKSSGSRGLHVLVDVTGPADYDLTRTFALAVAERVVARGPDRFTVAFHKKERAGRLFIDVLRNGRAAHAVAPYSLRARPEAPVAVPLSWDEALSSEFHPRRITIANVFRRLGQRPDPWSRRQPPELTVGEALAAL